MSRRGFFRGVILGGAVAGGLALLFAPKAGKELREDIARKARNMSDDLDDKLKQAKKNASKLDGSAKARQLEMIERAEMLRAKLMQRSQEFSKSGKKVTKLAANETQKLIEQGKVLTAQLDQYKSGAAKDASKFVKNATRSASRVMKAAQKEVGKDAAKLKADAAKLKKK